MRRHGSQAWLLLSSLTLSLGCGSSSEKTAPDGATDAAVDRASGPADRAPDRMTVEHAPDTTVADLAPDASGINPAFDGAGALDASFADLGPAPDSPQACCADTPAIDLSPKRDLAMPVDVARPEAQVSEGGAPGVPDAGLASINVTPGVVNLGHLELGDTGIGLATVTNLGPGATGPLTLTASAGMAVSGCGENLAPGASCVLTVTVTPTLVGNWVGTIAISTAATATPLVLTVIATVGGNLALAVQPSAIDLGTITVGEVASQNIVVTATTTVSDLSVAVAGTDVRIDMPKTTCTSVIAANTTCTVVLRFVAESAGPRTNAVIVQGGGTMVSVPITAFAVTPAKLAITPNTAVFAAAPGATSSTITFNVGNVGGAPTGLLAVALSGTHAADFGLTTTCAMLAPGSVCTVVVTFTPSSTSAATETAVLTVRDTGPADSATSATLSGHVVRPAGLAISSATSDLGSVVVGQTGSPVAFSVSNGGDLAAGPLQVAISGPAFVITNDSCTAAILAKGTTCAISIALRPTVPAVYAATLTVSDPGSDSAVSKTMTGTGLSAAVLAASPATIDFGSVAVASTSSPQTLTIRNSGGVPTGALSVSKSGNQAAFPITANTCAAALAPAASCSLSIAFSPTAAGSTTAAFSVTDGASAATASVSGTGL